MKKLFLLLILSFFSTQSFAGSCPDGSEPVKSLSDDGTYFVYNCGVATKTQPSSSDSSAGAVEMAPVKVTGRQEVSYDVYTDQTVCATLEQIASPPEEIIAIAQERGLGCYDDFLAKPSDSSSGISSTTVELDVSTSTVQEGFDAYDKNDNARAYQIFKYHAEKGNASAMRMLGWIYRGGSKDTRSAIISMGPEENFIIALSWFVEAAKLNDTGAAYALGNYYYTGDYGVEKDFNKAFFFYEIAREAGHPKAQMRIDLICTWSGDDNSKFCKDPIERFEASAGFDGTYPFTINRFKEGEDSTSKKVRLVGSGTLEIKDGNISVGADHRILNTYSSIDKYDTFEGKIDNNGSVLASITFDACYGEGGCGEKKITLKGDIDARQLTGMYSDIKIVFELGKGIGDASNAFDGNYIFKMFLKDQRDGRTWNPGSGLIEINNGVLSISNKQRQLKDLDSSADKFDTFKGQIDSNGEIIAHLELNPCGPGYCEEQLILLQGNINDGNKLDGSVYNNIVTFELTKTVGSEEESNAFDGLYHFILVRTNPDGSRMDIGRGNLEIKNGVISVSKKGRVMHRLITAENEDYDTFEGTVDKDGETLSFFKLNPCGHGYCHESIVTLTGNINCTKKYASSCGLRLTGMHGSDINLSFNFLKTQPQKTTSSPETTQVATTDDDPTVSKVIEVIQGDKFIVDIAEPHELAGTNIKLFLRDVDAPDTTRRCTQQLEFGIKVRDFVAQKLANASSIKLANFRKTATGIIAQIIVDGKDLGGELIAMGFGSDIFGYWQAFYCSAQKASVLGWEYFQSMDYEESIYWYEKSLDIDPTSIHNGKTNYFLMQLYSFIGDENKSLEYLERAASLGHRYAVGELGKLYLLGKGVSKDMSKAKYLLKKAHEYGDEWAEQDYCKALPKDQQETCKF